MKIRAKKIGKGSLFKIILICQVVPFGILFLICGIAAAFGAETVTLNGVAKTGISGLITAAFPYLPSCSSSPVSAGSARHSDFGRTHGFKTSK